MSNFPEINRKVISMSESNDNFEAKLQSWLAACQVLVNEYYANHYINLTSPTLALHRRGSKFLRVDSDTSSYAFIALVDSESKALGKVKQGDVMRSATYKTPAKHARGSVFDDQNGMGMMGPYGPAYLNGPSAPFDSEVIPEK